MAKVAGMTVEGREQEEGVEGRKEGKKREGKRIKKKKGEKSEQALLRTNDHTKIDTEFSGTKIGFFCLIGASFWWFRLVFPKTSF